jgi:hypothetical protein
VPSSESKFHPVLEKQQMPVKNIAFNNMQFACSGMQGFKLFTILIKMSLVIGRRQFLLGCKLLQPLSNFLIKKKVVGTWISMIL